MNRLLTAAVAVAACVTSGAFAQSGKDSHNPAMKDSTPHHVMTGARGSNSFTQAQAQGRIVKAGYMHVSALKKDGNGVWRGMAYRGHAHVRVGLDYKGNIVR